ncbi:BlaI/MecI/CopY family transcriptional regulator [Fodinisporobacter ferrooxydans]|uniref:BlaI/MecI/CopY family transcriptional regulator n=1 Tax=Fodinisporobacter ferrooxydans TaxID=2901836 RepID=A0ABY4CSR3_9BACL|nr:BlaI/MecI/CopY family transcriptional regulator [Alicyclobacillaceae bacterium MYW30-H2]
MARRKDARSFHLNAEGIERVLGPLETEIMHIFWENGELSIREVRDLLLVKREISFNTVMTIIHRLAEKGLLQKKDRNKSSPYIPTKTKESFLAEISHDVTSVLIKDFGKFAVSQFVDILHEVDPSLLRELEKRIEKYK